MRGGRIEPGISGEQVSGLYGRRGRGIRVKGGKVVDRVY